ncbi:probable arginine--tRNA ligase, mitochondrial isoform X2 [Apis florea]|uniref:probable arginine--tRNA ligase, mitochondrial isoform X2 n=1 Tax=Apis florea TaxID=7463 RepID=UPI0012FEB358|nr:probable arginine--tRNA ligase, mitochondrial isoform X2 [Apis florea]
MSNFMRSIIFKKVIEPLQNKNNVYRHKIMSNLYVKFNKEIGTYSFVLPLKTKDYNLTNEIKNIINNNLKESFDNVIIKDNIIYFHILRNKYIKKILENNCFGVVPPLLIDNNKNIIVEFSSLNIAKPFHVGHLRSTIIGNCIANLNSFLHNQVTKINYLGDWGTQFGYIYLGMKIAKIDNIEIQTDPIKTLYNVYVDANKLAENDPDMKKEAKKIFQQLELGDNVIHKNWETIKQFTVLELEKTYKRIGVIFDQYDWESMYTIKNINKIINKMEEMQLLKLDNNNRKVININEQKSVPILKSDGTTLYLSRDIAAAIDRLKHVKFGRVQGMSTRKGNVIFLEDILNKAKEVMRERQLEIKTTKITLDKIDEISDILGVSCVIIHDLKQNRMNNYIFNWNSILDVKGDCGIKLQYSHCRLCNLEESCGITLVTKCDPNLLKELEVDNLITLISQFDEIVLKAYEELEPCILTIYLFHLCKSINIAWHKLNVKNEPSDLANQRLLLFHVAKIILAQGMKLLGLTPLKKI